VTHSQRQKKGREADKEKRESRNRGLFLFTWDVPVDQYPVQALVNQVLNQQAVISPDGLNPFGVHLVVLVRIRPQQPSVPLLTDKQVGAVHLLELEFDGLSGKKANGRLSLIRTE
jgi:hypothetical protein